MDIRIGILFLGCTTAYPAPKIVHKLACMGRTGHSKKSLTKSLYSQAPKPPKTSQSPFQRRRPRYPAQRGHRWRRGRRRRQRYHASSTAATTVAVAATVRVGVRRRRCTERRHLLPHEHRGRLRRGGHRHCRRRQQRRAGHDRVHRRRTDNVDGRGGTTAGPRCNNKHDGQIKYQDAITCTNPLHACCFLCMLV